MCYDSFRSAASHAPRGCDCKRSVVLRHKTANLLLIKTTRGVYRASGRVKLIHILFIAKPQKPLGKGRP